MIKRIQWEALPWHSKIKIVKSGVGWVAIHKAEGVRSHPNREGMDRNALLAAHWDPKSQTFEVEGTAGSRLVLCHRLDAPTSGILLLACTEMADEILAAFRSNTVNKMYYALLWGRPTRSDFIWKSRLNKLRKDGARVRVKTDFGGEWAETQGKVIGVGKGGPALTLVKLWPITGRTHQLRVQAADHGLPIAGDRTYGNFSLNRQLKQRGYPNRLYLHAHSIEVKTKKAGGITVESDLPASFAIR